MSTKNARILGIRLDEDDAAILDQIEAKTYIPPVSIVRAAMKAITAHWKQKRTLALPLHIIDAEEYELLKVEKHQPQTVNLMGPTAKTAASSTNIMHMPPQHIAADAPADNSSLPPAQKVISGSGKPRQKKAR